MCIKTCVCVCIYIYIYNTYVCTHKFAIFLTSGTARASSGIGRVLTSRLLLADGGCKGSGGLGFRA